MIVEGASLCLLSLLIRRRFIFRPLESSGAGFWEVWFMSAYLIIIKFNISYFLGVEPLLFNGSNKRIPIFLVPNSTDLKNCSEFCCAFQSTGMVPWGGCWAYGRIFCMLFLGIFHTLKWAYGILFRTLRMTKIAKFFRVHRITPDFGKIMSYVHSCFCHFGLFFDHEIIPYAQ